MIEKEYKPLKIFMRLLQKLAQKQIFLNIEDSYISIIINTKTYTIKIYK